MSATGSARFEPKEGDELGRKKIKISRITSQKSRQVTFNKRKVGLMKKAMELSILCDCEIAVILFDHQKQLYQYSTRNTANGMEQMIQRWKEYDGNYEALTNNDLQTLKPGRAASFRVGKKRKSSNGKAIPVGKGGVKHEDDDDEEEEEDEDEDEGGTNVPDSQDITDTPTSNTRETRSTYKHTNTHPLHSPGVMLGEYKSQAAAMGLGGSVGQTNSMSMQQQQSMLGQGNSLVNTVHPMLTPLGSGHSFAAMLSPASLPSGSSLGGANFGSNYPFNVPGQGGVGVGGVGGSGQTQSALQQVLNSQASLLTPTSVSTPTGSHGLFASALHHTSSMSPSQLNQLTQQIHQHQMQQQQVAAGVAVATRIVQEQQAQQQQQQQQQQLAAALAGNTGSFNLQESIMNKMMQGAAGQGGYNRSPTVASALAAAIVTGQSTSMSGLGAPSSNGLGALLSPSIPPSPGSLFNQPLQSPSVFGPTGGSVGPYGTFLSQHSQPHMSHQMQQIHAVNQANMLQQQQAREQAQFAAIHQQQLAAAAMKSPSIGGPLSPHPMSARGMGHLLGGVGSSIMGGGGQQYGMPPLAPNPASALTQQQMNGTNPMLMSGSSAAMQIQQLHAHQHQQNQQGPLTLSVPMDLTSPHSAPASSSVPPLPSASSALSGLALTSPVPIGAPGTTTTSVSSSSSQTTGQATSGATVATGPASAVSTSSSSSSSLLSKRAPFKAALSLEIPTKPNVSGGVDITNAPDGSTATGNTHQQESQQDSQRGSQQQQQSSTEQVKMEIQNLAAAASAAAQEQAQSQQQQQSQSHVPLAQSQPVSVPTNQMSSYTGSMNMQMGYSPLTSPSTFLSADHSHAQFDAALRMGSVGGMGQPVTGQSSSASSAASQSHQSQSMHVTSTSGMQYQSSLIPPVSPYGQWGSSFSHAMDGSGMKIYSPTALRSPAAAAALFSRTFQ